MEKKEARDINMSPDNPGTLPITQVTRDQIAQGDHDKLVEYGVMLQNIMSAQLRLEQQIKELIQGQAAALTAWETSSKIVHDAQDSRIRKMEDLAVQYVPMANDFMIRIKTLEQSFQVLNDSKQEIIGGWRFAVWIAGSMAGFASTIWIIAQLIFNFKVR